MATRARTCNRTCVAKELRHRIDQRVRSGSFSIQLLGAASGFPNQQALSAQLHGNFPATRLNFARWQRVAECVGFTGEALERKGHE